MNYIKPEVNITKFDIVEDITGDFLSVGTVNPDDSNKPVNPGNIGFEEIDTTNKLNLGQ